MSIGANPNTAAYVADYIEINIIKSPQECWR